jgi:hypothetical protein
VKGYQNGRGARLKPFAWCLIVVFALLLQILQTLLQLKNLTLLKVAVNRVDDLRYARLGFTHPEGRGPGSFLSVAQLSVFLGG